MEVVLFDINKQIKQYGDWFLDYENTIKLFEYSNEYFNIRDFAKEKLHLLDYFTEVGDVNIIKHGNYVIDKTMSVFYEINNLDLLYEFNLKDDVALRTDKTFIDIIKSLPKSFPTCLKIVDIPDNVEFDISLSDYTDSELIIEKHRTWKIK